VSEKTARFESPSLVTANWNPGSALRAVSSTILTGETYSAIGGVVSARPHDFVISKASREIGKSPFFKMR
jgi:hypothetical protein